ncbi:histidine phosphatase family protein [Litchfieldella xinjiangensis]|uniref:histidine phosphatase family protein n=1 Tax=Litchfieldella xinjiangensis TaxID=1166948 RepID=UPI0005BC22F1|nr:histidine phosphatase family protein [Halomonas xinjiangensis]
MSLHHRPFVFMRHGETSLNREGRLGGSTDSPLTPLGEEQARAASIHLEHEDWPLIVTSRLARARRTAELALPGREFVSLGGLNERDWGECEGIPLSRQPAYEATPPGGESWDAFQSRVLGTLNQLICEADLPLIIAHSGVFRVIHTQIYGTPYGERIANAEPVLIEPTCQGWKISPFRMHEPVAAMK